MRSFLKFFFLFLLLPIYLLLSPIKTSASTVTFSIPTGASPADAIHCADNSNYSCNNGPSVSDAGGCGAPCNSNDTSPWSKYIFNQCYDDGFGAYLALATRANDVCSTGDKLDGNDSSTLDYGQCSCATGLPYKTCCNGRTPVSANSYAVDPYSPLEADCGSYTEIRCGDVGAACGAAACEAAFPTPTPSPTPTCSDPCSLGSSKVCVNSSSYKTCVADSNSPTGGCYQTKSCSSDNPDTPVCDTNTNTCVPSPCINGDSCTVDQVGQTICANTTDTKTCFSIGGAYCWIQTGAGFCSGSNSVCQNGSNGQTPTCVTPALTQKYSCSNNSCVLDSNGTYSDLSSCNAGCGGDAVTPPPVCGAGYCPIIQQCTGTMNYSLTITVPGFVSTEFFTCPVGTHCQNSNQSLCSGSFNCPVSTCVADPPAQINGHIFTDYNSNRIKDSGEGDYTGAATITTNYSPGPYAPAFCSIYPGGVWPCDYYYGGINYPSGWCAAQCTGKPQAPPTTPGCFGGNYSSCLSYCNSNPTLCNNNPASFCNSYCATPSNPNDWKSCCGGSYASCSSWYCGYQSSCGTTCTGTNTAPASPVTSVNNSNGTYSVTGLGGGALTYGTYGVSVNIPGATFSEPQNAKDRAGFAVTAGSSGYCYTGGSANASCSNGAVSNLNFGIKGNNPWIQSQGADLRQDAGFSNSIPADATCGSYASLPGSGNTPGIIYSGDRSYSFGAGSASSTNWVAGGSSYPSSYSPTRPNLIRTSYNYLLSVAQSASITATDLTSFCSGGGLNNCLLSSSIPNGLYIANGDLTLVGIDSTYTFPANKNFVILVNGNLNIKTKILVPTGSTATFSSSGNITVDRSIGESTLTSTASDIEGYYSADKNFILDGANNCSTPDKRINIAGSVVVNANLSGVGTFTNNRNLCAGNDQCPTFFVKERTDFVLNAPEFIKHPSYIYQETAP